MSHNFHLPDARPDVTEGQTAEARRTAENFKSTTRLRPQVTSRRRERPTNWCHLVLRVILHQLPSVRDVLMSMPVKKHKQWAHACGPQKYLRMCTFDKIDEVRKKVDVLEQARCRNFPTNSTITNAIPWKPRATAGWSATKLWNNRADLTRWELQIESHTPRFGAARFCPFAPSMHRLSGGFTAKKMLKVVFIPSCKSRGSRFHEPTRNRSVTCSVCGVRSTLP